MKKKREEERRKKGGGNSRGEDVRDKKSSEDKARQGWRREKNGTEDMI